MTESIIHAGKAIYMERNRHMIDSSDICLMYLDNRYTLNQNYNSGTRDVYKYAVCRKKTIVNFYCQCKMKSRLDLSGF